MSTNYYARIIPSEERKKELIEAVKDNDFPLIKDLTEELHGKLHLVYDTETLQGGIVHLGKSSGGWKFLWNPNVYVVRNGHYEDVEDRNGIKHRKYVVDPDTPCYLYPLTKKGIKEFIDREDVVIYNEYNALQDKEEFWKEATTFNNTDWDAALYETEYPRENRWQCKSELIDLLEREGYKFGSWTRADFYSDGLRFATTTDFS